MRTRRKKGGALRKISSKIFLLILILLVGGMAKITYSKFIEVREARELLSQKEKKIQEAKERNQQLEEALQYFEGNLKEVAKQKLNMVEPNEKVMYVFTESEKEESPQNLDKASKSNSDNFFTQTIEYVKGIFKSNQQKNSDNK